MEAAPAAPQARSAAIEPPYDPTLRLRLSVAVGFCPLVFWGFCQFMLKMMNAEGSPRGGPFSSPGFLEIACLVWLGAGLLSTTALAAVVWVAGVAGRGIRAVLSVGLWLAVLGAAVFLTGALIEGPFDRMFRQMVGPMQHMQGAFIFFIWTLMIGMFLTPLVTAMSILSRVPPPRSMRSPSGSSY